MSLLSPLFLLGLAALAVPVLIHLVQRERKQTIAFPSLMFIRRIPYKSVRRRRIHHWMLLLLRAAALTLIVLAFARPFLRRPAAALEGGGGTREVVILLDRSYSMGYGDVWARAQAAARAAIRTLDAGDRASLVFFSRGAELAVRSTDEHGRLEAAVGAARPGADVTRYGPALKAAQTIFAESKLSRRELVMISDFQRAGWERSDDLRLPDGVRVDAVRVGAEPGAPNALVTGVGIQRGLFAGRERVTVTAAVTDASGRDRAIDVALDLEGREIQKRRATVRSGTSAAVTFAPFTLEHAYLKGSVRLAPDRLPRDDVFHFVLSPGEPVQVWVFAPEPREANLYLTRALAIGSTPGFSVQALPLPALPTFDFAKLRPRSTTSAGSVVVLNDGLPPRGALGDRLKRFVEAGGGLLVVAGSRARPDAPADDWLPARVGSVVDRLSEGGATLGTLDYGHAAFELFKAPRSGDFSGVRVYRYRALEPHPGAQVLARFDDGRPAVVERRLGRGSVMLWAVTVDNEWNDLPIKPVFLPLVHRTLSHLAGYQTPAAWMTVGQVLEINAADRFLVTPSGEQVKLASAGPRIAELSEQGFYEIRDRRRHERPEAVAVNIDVSESDLTPMDTAEVVAAITGRAGARPGAPTASPERVTPQDQERRQGLWWYLLAGGMLLLGIETVLSNRLSRSANVG